MSFAGKSKLIKPASFALCVALVLGTLAAAGCAPKETPEKDAAGTASATEEVSTVAGGTVAVNFLENNSGMFPDNVTTTEFLNAGNRGCNACHEDLFGIMKTLQPTHIIIDTGFGRNGTIYDCFGCHTRHVAETGPYLGDLLHGAHYSSKAFVDANGNCWSCHAVSTEQTYSRDGDYHFLLWEDIMFEPTLGGYVDGGEEYNEWWVRARNAETDTGWDTGFVSGVATDVDPSVDLTFDQRVTETEDVFVCDNFICDFDVVSSTEYGFEVAGLVNEPKTFTYEEILAMPQTTIVATQTCSTNGLGGSLISNPEMTGVTLNYLIEQCGGLKDECNQITFTGVPEENGWNGGGSAIESMWDNILIAYEMNGEALGKSWGALMAVEPGHPGGAWVKHINGIEAESVEEPGYLYDPSWSVNNPKDTTTHFWLNAGWFSNNGETFSMSEGVDLSGWGFGWTDVKDGLLIKQFKLSFDYGETWTTFDIPSGMDPYQWVCFDMHWDPPAAGTYVIKLDAVNENGDSIKGTPGCANLLVNVTE